MRRYAAIVVTAALPALLAGCGATRTSPYTQPSPAEFNADDSDERAIEIVDAMIEKLGGLEAWAEVKQIQWQQRVVLGDEIRGIFLHAWDRWNSRHRWEQPQVASAEGAVQIGPGPVAKYRLYDPDDAVITYGGMEVSKDDKGRLIEAAQQTFGQSHWALAGYYKLKDPGVKLAYQGESEPMGGYCEPKCWMIHVSFDPEVGDDSYVLHVDTETGLPEILATSTGAGQLAYALAEWEEVAGLSFPVTLQNLGNDEERIEHANVQIGEVEKALYVPQAR